MVHALALSSQAYQLGILVIRPPTLPKTPKTNRMIAQAQPAWREATAVREMTPLFWAKVVSGRLVACERDGGGGGRRC